MGGIANGVADVAKGLNQRRTKSLIDFFSKASDENLNRARVVLVLPVPDAFAQLGAREDSTRFLHQDLKDIEFAR